MLRRAIITANSFQESKCPGYAFRHGHVSCPFEATLGLHSVVLNPHPSTMRVCWSPTCFRCSKKQDRLAKWMDRCKHNANGSRMCTASGCRSPLVDSLDCQEHAQARMSARLEHALRRHARRAANTSSPQRLPSLLKVPSPGDMRQWVSELRSKSGSPWDRHPVWSLVTDRLVGGGDGDGRAIYFVDTETILELAEEQESRTPLILELAVVDASGVPKLNTTLQHGDRTISELC